MRANPPRRMPCQWAWEGRRATNVAGGGPEVTTQYRIAQIGCNLKCYLEVNMQKLNKRDLSSRAERGTLVLAWSGETGGPGKNQDPSLCSG
jgi:hypothetical protein